MTLDEARRIDPAAEIGGEIRIPKPTDALGRIAAQTAKQVIFQKVREAERDTVYNEYSGRVGELVNCTVKRIEGPDVMFDLGKTEARMPQEGAVAPGKLQRGRPRALRDRAAWTRPAKAPGVVVSRAAPELVHAPVRDRKFRRSTTARW